MRGGVTQPAPIPIQPHDFTLALGMHGAHKVKRQQYIECKCAAFTGVDESISGAEQKKKQKHRNALMNLFFFCFFCAMLHPPRIQQATAANSRGANVVYLCLLL